MKASMHVLSQFQVRVLFADLTCLEDNNVARSHLNLNKMQITWTRNEK